MSTVLDFYRLHDLRQQHRKALEAPPSIRNLWRIWRTQRKIDAQLKLMTAK